MNNVKILLTSSIANHREEFSPTDPIEFRFTSKSHRLLQLDRFVFVISVDCIAKKTNMTKNMQVRKVGFKVEPPCLILVYTDRGKSRRRLMPLRNFTKRTGINRVVEELRERHQHLANVPEPQIAKILTVLQDQLNGLTLEASLAKRQNMDKLDPDEDLNRVDQKTLALKKQLMEKTFRENARKPGDPDYNYDVEVDFDEQIEPSPWDSDSMSDF